MNIAILGCESSHAEEFSARIHGNKLGKVTHVWDENHSLAKQKQNQIGADYCFKEIDKSFDEVDMVLIEGRYADSHFLPAYEALSREIPVYIDKPATSSYIEAKRLSELANFKKVPLRSFTAMAMSSEFKKFTSETHGFNHFIVGCPALCNGIDDDKAKDLSFYASHATDLLTILVKTRPTNVMCKLVNEVIWVTVEFDGGYLGSLYLPLKSEEFYFVQAMKNERLVQANINPFGDMYDNIVEYICNTFPDEGWNEFQFNNAINSMWIIDQIKKQVIL